MLWLGPMPLVYVSHCTEKSTAICERSHLMNHQAHSIFIREGISTAPPLPVPRNPDGRKKRRLETGTVEQNKT